jgi:hypothetical protein
MTSEEFHGLVEECSYDFDGAQRDAPLTLSRLAQLERQKGIRFPGFYKEFLSMYGPGDFGCVTVLSPDPKSSFAIWETTSRLENRECNFIGVVEVDSDYYGFLVEQGVCSNDIWSADHDFGYQIGDAGYPDFFDFLAKVALMSGITRRKSSRKTKGKRSEQPPSAARARNGVA